MKKILTASLILGMILFTGCAAETTTNDTQDNQTSSNETFMQTDTPKAGDTIVTIKTTHGDMKAVLFSEQAPEISKNFVELANAKKYDGNIFHRVIKDFMIQGGDFENMNGTGGHSYKGPGTMLDDEIHADLKHLRGTLSMANRGPNTNGSQFFIVHAPETAFLNGGYSIFGQVYEGFDVIDTIADVQTNPMDKPLEDVVIESVEVGEY